MGDGLVAQPLDRLIDALSRPAFRFLRYPEHSVEAIRLTLYVRRSRLAPSAPAVHSSPVTPSKKAACPSPDMRHVDGNRRAVDQHDLVRPVELVRLAGRKAKPHMG